MEEQEAGLLGLEKLKRKEIPDRSKEKRAQSSRVEKKEKTARGGCWGQAWGGNSFFKL